MFRQKCGLARVKKGDLCWISNFVTILKMIFDEKYSKTRHSARCEIFIITKPGFYFSGIYTDRKDVSIDPRDPNDQSQTTQINPVIDRGYQSEVQYLLRKDNFNVTAGGGTYRFNVERRIITDDGSGSCPVKEGCDSPLPDVIRKRENAYIYTNLNFQNKINATFGLGYDFFKYDISQKDFDLLGLGDVSQEDREKVSVLPKLAPSLVCNGTWPAIYAYGLLGSKRSSQPW